MPLMVMQVEWADVPMRFGATGMDLESAETVTISGWTTQLGALVVRQDGP